MDLTDGPLPGALQTYAAVSAEPEATWTATRSSVPLPSTLLLFGVGLWCLHVSRNGNGRSHNSPF
ncbi:MAG: PEP-CTERM sorting domain-containing protein [Magnetospirillum sp.]|nr:MAG: PEP-CTERM sorting domain-containing protein [Magnetospirillum sp.]